MTFSLADYAKLVRRLLGRLWRAEGRRDSRLGAWDRAALACLDLGVVVAMGEDPDPDAELDAKLRVAALLGHGAADLYPVVRDQAVDLARSLWPVVEHLARLSADGQHLSEAIVDDALACALDRRPPS